MSAHPFARVQRIKGTVVFMFADRGRITGDPETRRNNTCARVRYGFDKTSKAFLRALTIAIRASGFN
ncbi:MAG: hypothetical protein DMG98_13835 [Acidobacteria bacterium]|nr:MAG: hypothetical protein DMG98_13835 [Acidobacteriota bacterium]